MRRHGANSRKEDRPGLCYPLLVNSDGKIVVPPLTWFAEKREWVLKSCPKGYQEVWPLRGAEMRVWSYAPDRAKKELKHLEARNVDGEWQIYRKIRMKEAGVMPQTVWIDRIYSAGEHGTGLLKNILGEADKFSFPKSVYTVADCIRVASTDTSALIVDFFGGSGTTFNSIALMNAEDGGNPRLRNMTL